MLWLDEHRAVSLRELVEISGLSEAELLELVHSGALPVRDSRGRSYSFSARVVTVARTACRLRDDFELDTRGVARGAAAARARARSRRGNRALARARCRG